LPGRYASSSKIQSDTLVQSLPPLRLPGCTTENV
jgi:hypothetical protein